MNIPDGIGWSSITEKLKNLDVVGINHISFGFPPKTPKNGKPEIEKFFFDMGALLEKTSRVHKNKPNEWFIYPDGKKPGYEHLLMPDNTIDRSFYHIEIDVKNTDSEMQEVFPEAWQEQPHMYWLTVSKSFMGILWAVIITNKRYLNI